MRIPMIAANWKMHKNISEAVQFIDQYAELLNAAQLETVICPAFPLLAAVGEACRRHGLRLGAQNMYWETAGAFTGEVSPLMLKDLQVDYVIIGHSERRRLFGETDQQVARKIKAACQHEIIPILCVGETLEQRQAQQTLGVISEQVTTALAGLDPSQVRKIVIAYEPVWAIGSGLAATAADADAVAAQVRKIIGEQFNLKTAQDVRILYGGSVNRDNIAEFMQAAEIDGALVGGASLDASVFAAIVNTAAEVSFA
ncbi:MAG: triose-phosphate isomerase [Firmicutes bacterium]|nr:triose-phosphate isomerase [Bacillota bacterium]